MTINANSVGNYNIYGVRQAAASAAPRQTAQAAITQDEKNFFASMYPDQKATIADYHFYERSGKTGGVSVGSLFDRRM